MSLIKDQACLALYAFFDILDGIDLHSHSDDPDIRSPMEAQ
jgi:hypothetical protein